MNVGKQHLAVPGTHTHMLVPSAALGIGVVSFMKLFRF